MADAKLPPNFRDTIEDTRDLIHALLDRMGEVAGSTGKRWIDGFDGDDAKASAADLGAKLLAQVTEAWQKAQDNVTPPPMN